MSGRRVQRSVRVTVAAALLGLAAVIVAVSVATSVLVGAAAVASLVAGAVASRIVYSELVQTRGDAARQRSEQARSFQSSIATSHAEHLAFTETMAARLDERDRLVAGLGDRVRRTERRAVEAEARVKREARRANEAQERLAAVLDEVLGTDGFAVDRERGGPDEVLPTVVDLRTWDARSKADKASAAPTARAR